jgi:hypothetical protein
VTAYATYNRPLLPGRLFVAFLCGADWQGPAVAANSCKETSRIHSQINQRANGF